MYYTVYKTINIINNNFYIGVHKTNNVDDDYIGSGKRLKYAVKKYGRVNFRKEILAIFTNANDAYNLESTLVTGDTLLDSTCYNIKLGGEGGFDFLNKYDQTERNRKISKARNYNDPEYKKKLSHIIKEKYAAGVKMGFDKGEGIEYTIKGAALWRGCHHSEETKKRIAETRKQKHIGYHETNSQYGSMWITDGTYNKKIKNVDTIPHGWYKGRTV